MSKSRFLTLAALLIVGAFSIHMVRLWQPERLVPSLTADYLKAAGDRKWPRARNMMAESYSDRWGGTREESVELAASLLKHFFGLTIESQEVVYERAGEEATVSALLRFRGNGTAIAQEIQSRVNSMETPFVFSWKKMSWKPWDWKLIRIENSEAPGGVRDL